MSLSYSEAAKPAHWLLDIEIAGSMYRYASSAVTVTDDSGAQYEYEEGLSNPSIGLVQDGAAEMSVGITLASEEDWALIEARGYNLERARGVLRRWWEGTTLERARVYLRGLSTGVEYGAAGEGLTFTLTRAPTLESRDILDPQMLVDATTWPVRQSPVYTRQEKVEGSSYQLVIGAPGHDPAHGTPRAAVPALLVEARAATASSGLLLSFGQMAAVGVRIHNITIGLEGDGVPILTADLLGRPCTYSQVGSTALLNVITDEFWYGLAADATYGGGVRHPRKPGEMLRGAGDVLAWGLTEYTSIVVDRGQMAAHSDWLNAFSVDTYLNTPTDAWSWLTGAVLSWVPVVVRESEYGMYFLPVRWDYTSTDVTAWLSVERGDIGRDGTVKRLSQPIYNEITVQYRPKREGKKWHSTHTLTAKEGTLSVSNEVTDDARISGSNLAQLSQAEYGIRPKTISIPHTWSDDTAVLVARLLLQRYAWPKRTIQYTASQAFEALEPGMCVALSDAELHLTDAVAYVVDTTPTSGGVTLDLILLDHPTHTTTV
jgi:hypothetical protein